MISCISSASLCRAFSLTGISNFGSEESAASGFPLGLFVHCSEPQDIVIASGRKDGIAFCHGAESDCKRRVMDHPSLASPGVCVVDTDPIAGNPFAERNPGALLSANPSLAAITKVSPRAMASLS